MPWGTRFCFFAVKAFLLQPADVHSKQSLAPHGEKHRTADLWPAFWPLQRSYDWQVEALIFIQLLACMDAFDDTEGEVTHFRGPPSPNIILQDTSLRTRQHDPLSDTGPRCFLPSKPPTPGMHLCPCQASAFCLGLAQGDGYPADVQGQRGVFVLPFNPQEPASQTKEVVRPTEVTAWPWKESWVS